MKDFILVFVRMLMVVFVGWKIKQKTIPDKRDIAFFINKMFYKVSAYLLCINRL